MKYGSAKEKAISRVALAFLIIAIIVVSATSAIYFVNNKTSSSSTTTSSSSSLVGRTSNSTTSLQSSSSSSSLSTAATASQSSISSLTWETPTTVDYLDPHVSYTEFAYSILQNVYEPLLWFNGSCSSCVIPWLAENYTVSPDLTEYRFTLRSNITFADGEPLNSTAVYFSLNRLLIEDGSTPVSHGTQASFILQQLLNTSLSTTLCGCKQSYDSSYVRQVLGENFVQITGPMSFSIHLEHPNFAFRYMLGDVGSDIVAPNYVITKDVSLWNSSGYTLPYPNIPGSLSETARIFEYFSDEVSTCGNGTTAGGCGTTYLDGSNNGSLAGTGPYTVKSFDASSNDIVLQANGNYWGGPLLNGSKIIPKIGAINVNYVPDQATRLLDLENAGKSGSVAMVSDIENDHLYDVANRSLWLSSKSLQSIVPGVTLYGPYSSFYTFFAPFAMNVSSAQTGDYYQFQPFADIRFRLAFADAVNLTALNQQVNNGMGDVAVNLIPPGLPPAGAYNASIVPRYRYNLTAVQSLLLDAMLHPITRFTYVNGTPASPGVFNNTFGCPSLGSSGACSNPVARSLSLTFYTGDTVDEAIFQQIAGVVNNISSTFNMGLTVSVTPVPFGQMSTEGFSDELYMYMIGGWGDDYPYAMDFLGPMFAPGQIYPVSDGWNFTQFGTLYNQAVNATAVGDNQVVAKISNEMNLLANQEVMYLWTFNPLAFFAMTSNIHGFYFNPSLAQEPSGFYFAAMY